MSIDKLFQVFSKAKFIQVCEQKRNRGDKQLLLPVRSPFKYDNTTSSIARPVYHKSCYNFKILLTKTSTDLLINMKYSTQYFIILNIKLSFYYNN